MKEKKWIIELLFSLVNILSLVTLYYLYAEKILISEIILALLLLQLLGSAFILFRYYLHEAIKNMGKKIGFRNITRFLEQSRLEGVYKKNWFQIHFASRDYGEYWGVPKTYIKLQYREPKKYDKNILEKYTDKMFYGMKIDGVNHIKRSYKNYLLMRVNWYIINKKKITQLMDKLLKIEKEAKIK